MAGAHDPRNGRRVRRDAGVLGKFERTPSGGLRIPADATRIGVFVYPTVDGAVVRELRHPDDVLAAESWSSLEDAPVTIDHPPSDNGAEGFVVPENWKQLAVGSVRNVRVDGSKVAADVIVLDAGAIREIEQRELVEVSLGYVCELEFIGGVYEGEQYDARQRSIRYNHLALGPEGWGRGGPDVALRLDGGPGGTMRKIRVDGIEYDAGSDSHIQASERLVERLTGELATARKELGEQRVRADGAQTKLDAEIAAHAETKKKLDAETSDEEMDKRVEARMGLIDAARRVMGDDYEYAGKSDREVMSDTLEKAGHQFSDDDNDDVIGGMFRAATKADTTTASDEPDADRADPDKDFVGADSKKRTQTTKRDGGTKRTVRVDKDTTNRPEPPDANADALAEVQKKNEEYAKNFDARFPIRKTR